MTAREGNQDLLLISVVLDWTSQEALVVKNSLANAGDIKVVSSIPGSGRSPGGEHGNPLQYSCLENPTDRGVWWATVHGVEKGLNTIAATVCAHSHGPRLTYYSQDQDPHPQPHAQASGLLL